MEIIIPSVSIIVPVYNSEAYLNDCLDSITQQTLRNIEIICINDGSTDNSIKILKDYAEKDSRIAIIDKQNGGQASARNVGIKKASGEYIGFVDSDDWIDEHYFEKLYRVSKESKADMAMGDTKLFTTQHNKKVTISSIGKLINRIEKDIVDNVVDKRTILTIGVVCDKLFLRAFINNNNIQFFEGLFWEDTAFAIMTIIEANKICLVRDTFYHYRIHTASTTGRAFADKKSFDIFGIMARLKVFFDTENIHALEGYRYYYNELLMAHYCSHLVFRVHKKYRKEFFMRVKTEFKAISSEGLKSLSFKYFIFLTVKNCSYGCFLVIENFILALKFSNYFLQSVKNSLFKLSNK